MMRAIRGTGDNYVLVGFFKQRPRVCGMLCSFRDRIICFYALNLPQFKQLFQKSWWAAHQLDSVRRWFCYYL